MIPGNTFDRIDPFVRMMRLKKEFSMSSGKWRDIDHVYTYISSGNAEFIIEGERYSLHRGNVIIIPPYMTHLIMHTGAEPLVQNIIHFDFFETKERAGLPHRSLPADLQGIPDLPGAEDLLGGVPIVADIPENRRNEMVKRYLEMLEEFQEDRCGRGRMLKASCTMLLVDALRSQVDWKSSADSGIHKSKAWIYIEQAIDYIQNTSFTEPLDNESIAAAVKVSANYLTGVFQNHLGMSLHRYVIDRKIAYARQLLLEGKVNVTEAAALSGFSSIHAFSKTFKNIIGVSPSHFMDEMVYKEHIEENMMELQSCRGD